MIRSHVYGFHWEAPDELHSIIMILQIDPL
jgi:hypothetical protein